MSLVCDDLQVDLQQRLLTREFEKRRLIAFIDRHTGQLWHFLRASRQP
jgi:hypothetical protein